MYKNRNVFCFILARGGSKGIPRKNTVILSGKPLIAHSIDLAKKVKYIDKIFVSTEDAEIKKISLECGAFVVDRPEDLATDTSYYLDAVKHMISKIDEQNDNPLIVLLETTSPIRKIEDVEKCIELYEGVDVVLSIHEVKTHPSRMFRIRDDLLYFYLNRLPSSNRQEEEKLFAVNGSIIVSDCAFLKKQDKVIFGGRMKGYLLDEKHSMDIDSPFDLEICKTLMDVK